MATGGIAGWRGDDGHGIQTLVDQDYFLAAIVATEFAQAEYTRVLGHLQREAGTKHRERAGS
jgi:hypothetical protein